MKNLISKDIKLVVISAPSGCGKTSIIKTLLERMDNLCLSISATTRTPRENEKHGEDYYFIDIKTFKQKIDEKQFLEYQEVYPNLFYGTLFKELEIKSKEKKNIIFEIDVNGGIKIKKLFAQNCLSIFLAPPSLLALKERLIIRGQDNKENISIRVKKAEKELKLAPLFDTIILNDNIEKCLMETQKSIHSFLKSF